MNFLLPPGGGTVFTFAKNSGFYTWITGGMQWRIPG
jgi:hypothetical protein